MNNSWTKDEQNLINLSIFYALKNPVNEKTSVDFLGANRPNIDIKELPNGTIILTVLDNPKDDNVVISENNDSPTKPTTSKG
jgi:hypothetical protein